MPSKSKSRKRGGGGAQAPPAGFGEQERRRKNAALRGFCGFVLGRQPKKVGSSTDALSELEAGSELRRKHSRLSFSKVAPLQR